VAEIKARIRFERQSGGAEELELGPNDEWGLTDAGLFHWGTTLGKRNSGIPLLYLKYAVPAADIRWVEEVIPEDDRGL
jgi:hypothetical protein